MKTIIDKANTRGYFNHGWLKTYHTFSFADYYNPRRIHFGALRVLNDDTVAPGEGFGIHPHKNRLSRFLAGIIFYTREVLLTSHYEKRLFEHASQPRVACADIRLLSYLWSRTNLSRDSYQSG